MKYIVRKSFVRVLGRLWLPTCIAATQIALDGYALENMRATDGTIRREDVSDWLDLHAGDFSEVTDFSASIEDGDITLDFPWSSEDNECSYHDCMNPEED